MATPKLAAAYRVTTQIWTPRYDRDITEGPEPVVPQDKTDTYQLDRLTWTLMRTDTYPIDGSERDRYRFIWHWQGVEK